MKKILIASLIATSLAASAYTQEDWIVESDNTDPVVYSVLPATATFVRTDEDIEARVVIEIYAKSDEETVVRYRLRVNGCKNGTGKVTIANMDSTLIKNNRIFDWDISGGRVYDMLAVRACAAAIEKLKETKQGPSGVKNKDVSV